MRSSDRRVATAKTRTGTVLQVAVPSPLHKSFDYLPPEDWPTGTIEPGMRVLVPFGRRRVTGVVLATQQAPRVANGRLRPVATVLDRRPILPRTLLRVLLWASDYYHYPIGEVVASALPALLRRGRDARSAIRFAWRPTELGRGTHPESLDRAPRQAELLTLLQRHPEGLTPDELSSALENWQRVSGPLSDKGLIERVERDCLRTTGNRSVSVPPKLNSSQSTAVSTITEARGFAPYLLEGITGSGKTEVYMGVIEAAVRRHRQALVLVPEIGLTPQLMARFRARFPEHPIAVLHSGLSDSERLCAWQSAAEGKAPIVVGTRSAVFVPLARPGLIIVDEEHDLSFKQQEGFRYHARDVAVVRARDERIAVVLGSATPSLESLHNANRGSYGHIHLPERAGSAKPPQIGLIDVRHQRLDEGLSERLIERVSQHLGRDAQVLLFINRRGFAPTLMCHECGWIARCQRCDANLTVHARERRLRCHHCGAERSIDRQCPDCGSSDLLALGQGTERLETALLRRFPDSGVVRIDRDTTRRKGAMAERLAEVREGHHRILIGTQMLAKGHHFPQVTLAVIVDIDQGLFSADFRAPERMAQLVVQVAGRAGRSERPGEMMIQTHHPDHPLLRTLIDHGYPAFAEAALEERRAAGLPPFASLALVRAEATQPEPPVRFLESARRALGTAGASEVEILGPVAAPMELRAGRYRAHLLLRASRRPALQDLLRRSLPTLLELREARRVRWSIDVDPMEMF